MNHMMHNLLDPDCPAELFTLANAAEPAFLICLGLSIASWGSIFFGGQLVAVLLEVTLCLGVCIPRHRC